jgi:hypothetical protein
MTEAVDTKDSVAPAIDTAAVQERLAFFFSNANIRQDAFLRKFLTNTATSQKYPGMIPVETLLSFNTLKKITQDPDAVVQVAKDALSNLLVVSGDSKALGLVTPWSSDKMDENIPLTLVVANLPVEGDDGNLQYVYKTEQVKELFTQYGHVALCRLRFKAKSFKQKEKRQEPLKMAFVEFESKDSLDKAVEDTLTLKEGATLEPKRKVTLGDTELVVRTLADYIAERKAEKGDEGGDSQNNSSKKKREREEEAFSFEWKPGCVIQLKGLPDDCDREAIIAVVARGLDTTVDDVKNKKVYADYSRGQKDGAIRFAEPEGVADLCAKISSGDLKFGDAKIESAHVLDGDDEKKYWDEFIAFKNKQMKHKREEKYHRKKKFHKR